MPANGLEGLELVDEPLDLVAGIVPALQDVEVVLVASEGVKSDDFGIREGKAILESQVLGIISVLGVGVCLLVREPPSLLPNASVLVDEGVVARTYGHVLVIRWVVVVVPVNR